MGVIGRSAALRVLNVLAVIVCGLSVPPGVVFAKAPLDIQWLAAQQTSRTRWAVSEHAHGWPCRHQSPTAGFSSQVGPARIGALLIGVERTGVPVFQVSTADESARSEPARRGTGAPQLLSGPLVSLDRHLRQRSGATDRPVFVRVLNHRPLRQEMRIHRCSHTTSVTSCRQAASPS